MYTTEDYGHSILLHSCNTILAIQYIIWLCEHHGSECSILYLIVGSEDIGYRSPNTTISLVQLCVMTMFDDAKYMHVFILTPMRLNRLACRSAQRRITTFLKWVKVIVTACGTISEVYIGQWRSYRQQGSFLWNGSSWPAQALLFLTYLNSSPISALCTRAWSLQIPWMGARTSTTTIWIWICLCD